MSGWGDAPINQGQMQFHRQQAGQRRAEHPPITNTAKAKLPANNSAVCNSFLRSGYAKTRSCGLHSRSPCELLQ